MYRLLLLLTLSLFLLRILLLLRIPYTNEPDHNNVFLRNVQGLICLPSWTILLEHQWYHPCTYIHGLVLLILRSEVHFVHWSPLDPISYDSRPQLLHCIFQLLLKFSLHLLMLLLMASPPELVFHDGSLLMPGPCGKHLVLQ